MLAGTGKRSLLLAFMIVTTLLSMFICNTATCAMMVPILTVVLDQLYPDTTQEKQKNKPCQVRERTMFYLAVAYCANIGGTGTVTAEETNLIIMVFKRGGEGDLYHYLDDFNCLASSGRVS